MWWKSLFRKHRARKIKNGEKSAKKSSLLEEAKQFIDSKDTDGLKEFIEKNEKEAPALFSLLLGLKGKQINTKFFEGVKINKTKLF